MKQDSVRGHTCLDYTDECVSMKIVRIIHSYLMSIIKWCRENKENEYSA